MKLSKVQVIILIILFFIWKNKNSPNNYVADVSNLNLESKAISGLNVLLSDLQPTESQNQYSVSEEEVDTPKVLKERLVLLTDSINCVPCIQFEESVLNFLRNEENKSLGWRVGNKNDDHLQIVDYNYNQDLFEHYVSILDVNGIYDIGTPMLFKITSDNKVQPEAVSYGYITANEFLNFYQTHFYNTQP